MKLTDHFWLSEFTESQTATRHGIDNAPSPEIIQNLRHTAQQMEAVRVALGSKVITVSSGYRCPELNAKIGGSATSQHMTGEACDFVCRSFGDPHDVPLKIAETPGIGFDQLIYEGTWVHISFISPRQPKPRREILTWSPRTGYSSGINPIAKG